jgi:hypothetical protein
MSGRSFFFLVALAAGLVVAAGCTRRTNGRVTPMPDLSFPDLGTEPDLGEPDLGPVDAFVPPRDMPFDPDMACTSTAAEALLERLPADIIWVVDNSSSMAEEIENVKAGINAFADFIAATGVDYRVIMLSKRGVGASGTRYSICVPPPLAGDDACGNGPRFFHSSIDILSTQPLEQILGTLGQTTGYTPADSRGGEPWRDWLRPEASKTFVVVTDDNARLSARNFENFRGPPPATEWRNPATTSTSLFLPPGILEPEWGGLFDGYKFSGVYGWNCPAGAGADPGATYSELVTSTGGVRADICAPPSTWGTFFESIATEVVRATRVSCDLAIPETPAGLMFSPSRINVEIRSGGGATMLRRTVGGLAGCASTPNGWYYDDDTTPTRVILCPAACELAQDPAGAGETSVQVQFGCESIFG